MDRAVGSKKSGPSALHSNNAAKHSRYEGNDVPELQVSSLIMVAMMLPNSVSKASL